MSLTRNCGGLGRAVSSNSVRMRLICSASSLASLMTARAALLRRQIAADNFDDAGNSGQGITDFVRQSGSQFAKSGKVFGPRHLRLVEMLDLLPAGLQLRHHVVEVAAQVADLVIAIGETDGNVHVSQADAGNLVLQFEHGAAHRDREHHDDRGANQETRLRWQR